MEADFVDGEMHLVVAVQCATDAPVRIRGLENLEGLVVIDDEAKALELVRLFSAGRRWMLTGIATFAEVFSGDKSDVAAFVVSQRAFTRCCTPPTVRRVTEARGELAFDVQRTVVDRAYAAYRVTERVSGSGAWRVVDRQRLLVNGRDLGLWVVHDR
jgi:hypothetical protein